MASEQIANTMECGIGVREILSGDGTVKRRLTVHCDFRGEGVDVGTCTDCVRCVAIQAPTDVRPGVVLCRRLDGDPPLSVDPDQRTPVRSVMEREIVCVRSDVSVATVASLLLKWGASGVPVVDESGHPIGMISATDLLRVHTEIAEHPASNPGASATHAAGPTREPPPRAGRTARDVMTPVVFTVVESTELARAAALMSGEGLHQLPVVLGDGSIGGLLSTCDVARWVAHGGRSTGVGATRSSCPIAARIPVNPCDRRHE